MPKTLNEDPPVSLSEISKQAVSGKVPWDRRRFLRLLGLLGIGGLVYDAVSRLAKSGGWFSFLNPGMGPEAFCAGTPEDYRLNQVDGRFQARGFWIVRHLEGLYVLRAGAPRCGCRVRWDAGRAQFYCTAHGNHYYKSGIYFEGPGRLSLERAGIFAGPGGEFWIDPAKRFRQERGEWGLRGSFLGNTVRVTP